MRQGLPPQHRAKLAVLLRGTEGRYQKSRLVIVLGLCLLVNGCVSNYEAERRAREAFQAGVQQGIRLQQQTQQPGAQSIRIVGDVKNPVLPWREGLTLAQALVAAGYNGTGQPTDILVVHNGVATQVDVSKLLAGEDTPLQPGDVVQIK